MNYWIFQGNPDIFDVTEYIAKYSHIIWSVRRKHLAKDMHPGDEVFLWRASGRKKEVAGVVAIAKITGEPQLRPDDTASYKHWRKGDPSKEELRVDLEIEKRCLGAKKIVKREWIEKDPELQGLQIIRVRVGTNFKITPSEAKRLAMLCRTVGSDWSYQEDVAALWIFKETEGRPVSQSAGSPVANVAHLTGRPLGGVYNKVMNFRHIDPRDSRKGLSNVNQLDRKVWDDFYLPAQQQLDSKRLDQQFQKMWPQAVPDIRITSGKTYRDFGEAPDDNPSELATFAARVRKGQLKFRKNLLRLYGERCAISGWKPPAVLEAAHIWKHAESGVNHSDNGILIRSDLHYLMDADLLTIDADTLEIRIDKSLRDTSYWELNGRILRQRSDGSRPSREYLYMRFSKRKET